MLQNILDIDARQLIGPQALKAKMAWGGLLVYKYKYIYIYIYISGEGRQYMYNACSIVHIHDNPDIHDKRSNLMAAL